MNSRSASRDQNHHYSPSHPRKEYYSSEGPTSSLEVSPIRHQRRIHEKEKFHGELKKTKPPTLDGENKRGEDVESWLLGMRRYFQLYQYSPNLEARISIYHLKGKASIWWEELAQVKVINENKITWRQLKKYFQHKYLSGHYYDRKIQEFFELKLGNMTMEKYERFFWELLRYVDYIKNEKSKICRFLSGLSAYYKDKIQYDEPKNIEATIRKAKYLYEQSKGRSFLQRYW